MRQDNIKRICIIRYWPIYRYHSIFSWVFDTWNTNGMIGFNIFGISFDFGRIEGE